MSATVDQLGKTLIASGLLTTDELTKLWSELPAESRPADAAALAKLLVERGKLTAFQAKEVLAGRGARLVLGDYVVVEEIGAGGMGRVYKAQHRRMHRMVALKVMSAAAMKDEASVKRFQREVRAAARLEHPNIVTAYASGESGNVKYLVMQFVDGPDLSSIVKKNGPLPIERAVDVVAQAARGLAYAHGEGVIHRDIKPANLLVDKKGTVKILDMGLARIESSDDGLTATEQVMGTVDYMSPEQASNTKGADARADIYSLGCTLWFVLTGKKLYEGDSMISRLMAHRDGALPSLVKTRDDAPWPLEQALHRMIAKRPDERFQSMDEVAAALAPFGPSGGSSTPMGSSIGMGSGPQNAELAAFMQGAPIAAAVQTKDSPSKSKVTTGATAQLSSPEVGTDSKRSGVPPSHLAAGLAPARSGSARTQAPRSNKKMPLLLGGGAVAVAAVAVIAWLATRGDDSSSQPTVAAAGAAAVSKPTPAAITQPVQQASPATPTPVVVSAAQGDAVAEKLETTKYVWTEPENLGLRVNDGTQNRGPTLTADQLCLIVETDQPGQSDLVEYRRANVNEPWGRPIYSVGSHYEERPCLSADGLQLLFNSAGWKGVDYVGGQDLYLRRRAGREAPWGPPEHLGPKVNTPHDEAGAALSPNGLVLAFHASRPDGLGSNDIWLTRRASPTAPFGPPENLGRSINTGGNESNPHIIDDSGRLYFERDGEIFLIFKNAAGATGAISLPNQTEKFRESWLAPDGSALYFHADNRPGGRGGSDVWLTRRVPRDSPEAKRIPPPLAEEPPPKIDAVPFAGHAYQWVRLDAITWYDAKRLAESMGGHLVTIESLAEDAWLKETLLKELAQHRMVWIGAVKEGDGVWKWSTGEPLEYSGWNPGEGSDGPVSAAGIALRDEIFGWADWGAVSRAVAISGPLLGQSRCVGFIVEWDAPTPKP